MDVDSQVVKHGMLLVFTLDSLPELGISGELVNPKHQSLMTINYVTH